MSEELKRCPCCPTGDGVLASLPVGYYVKCDVCGMKTSVRNSPEEAVDAWQQRPIEDALRAEIEELDELLRNAHDVLQTAKEAYNVYDYDEVMEKIRMKVCKS